ncbi:MAG: flagellar biosynthesis anti-sigma factor FlgM [Deltaproteobacteria bacterium]|nr:flagellar biosynthesis anti-sigma factor FlgM [Deltaproteobacteria bacterium]
MKINDVELPATPKEVKTRKSENAKSRSSSRSGGIDSSGGKRDQINISVASQQMQTLKGNYDSLPDIKVDRVSYLKQAIESGEYKPDYHEVAGALLKYLQGE